MKIPIMDGRQPVAIRAAKNDDVFFFQKFGKEGRQDGLVSCKLSKQDVRCETMPNKVKKLNNHGKWKHPFRCSDKCEGAYGMPLLQNGQVLLNEGSEIRK